LIADSTLGIASTLVLMKPVLIAFAGEAEVFAEEGHDVILEAHCHGAGVGALIDFEAVGDTVFVKDIVEFGGVDSQSILVADIHRNSAIPLQIGNVLVDEGEGGVGGPFGQDVGLGHSVFGGKVEIEGWIFWIGRPGCGAG